MLGLGISLVRSIKPLAGVRAITSFQVGDISDSGGVVYYVLDTDPSLSNFTFAFEALPYSIPIPKTGGDNFYDVDLEEEISYTTSVSNFQSVAANYKNIYNGAIQDEWSLLSRSSIPDIEDDVYLIGWFNNVYLPYKENFDPGFYIFPYQNASLNSAAVFSTETELFYDNVSLDALDEGHLVLSRFFQTEFINITPLPLTSPVILQNEDETFFPRIGDILLYGLDNSEIARNVTYNQRIHSKNDYREDLIEPDILTTSSLVREALTDTISISTTNREINLCFTQYSINTPLRAPWGDNTKDITLKGELRCLGPYSGTNSLLASLSTPSTPVQLTSYFKASTSAPFFGDTIYVSIHKFKIPQEIIKTVKVKPQPSLPTKTVAERGYYGQYVDSEDANTQRYKYMYFSLGGIVFTAPGYLESRPYNPESLTRIFVPTYDEDVANLIPEGIIQSLNVSLKPTSQLELATSVQPQNEANLSITPNLPIFLTPRYTFYELIDYQLPPFDIKNGDLLTNGEFVYNDTRQKIFTYTIDANAYNFSSDPSNDGFIQFYLVIELVKRDSNNTVTILEQTTLDSNQIGTTVQIPIENSYVHLEYSSSLQTSLNNGDLVYLRLKLTSPVSNSFLEGYPNLQILFNEETKLDVTSFPATSPSPNNTNVVTPIYN